MYMCVLFFCFLLANASGSKSPLSPLQANSELSKIFSAASVPAAKCVVSLCELYRFARMRVVMCDALCRYCLTQADTEAIAEYLMKSGIAAKS